MRRIAIFGLLVLLSIAACRKDEVTSTTTTTTTSPSQLVSTTIGGQVINEMGLPIENAKVFLGTKQSTTDENGVFLIRNAIVAQNGAYVRVEKGGYFHGSKTVIASAGTRNTVKIQLLANTSTKFVNSTTGGTADYTDYSITLPANGVSVGTATGSTFTGEVGVAAKWLDPTSTTFAEQAPGRLVGRSLDGSETGMVSMGMLAVELKAATGAKLQIKTGFQADIRMKVPAAFASKAPQSIPLWYFDEAAGIWVEEGSAELVNGFYEGKVGHFSFWNTDYKAPVVEVKFKVTDTNGNLVEGALVDTRLVSDGTFGRGYTNSQGFIWGIVPEGQVLDAKVILPNSGCVDPSIQQQIGPFSNGDSICFTVNITSLHEYTISGTLVNCAGAPVTEGYVKITPGNDIIWTDANGNFTTTFTRCIPLTSVELVGYDLIALKQSVAQTIDLSSGTANLGTISVCDALTEYFIYEFNGNTFSYPTVNLQGDTQGGIYTIIGNAGTQNQVRYNFNLPSVSGVGSTTMGYFEAYGTQNGIDVAHFCGNTGGNPNNCLSVDITEFNGLNAYMAGTFSGVVTDSLTQVNVSGSFRGLLK